MGKPDTPPPEDGEPQALVVQGSRDLQNAIRSLNDLTTVAPPLAADDPQANPDAPQERTPASDDATSKSPTEVTLPDTPTSTAGTESTALDANAQNARAKPASERSVEEVLKWKPDPVVSSQVDNALSSIAQFESMWAAFQKRFDDLNKAIVGNIGKMMGEGAPPRPSDTKEYNDPLETVEAEAKRLAGLMREAKCVMVLTGAGISTSAGICDYRGPQGKWTLEAKGIKKDITPVDTLLPTPCHMAIAKMAAAGIVRHVVSTNIDGLHGLSGVPATQLTEVHGNSFVERCNACNLGIERPFPVRYKIGRKEKATAGACPQCGGRMVDSIVNFGDSLRSDEWRPVDQLATQECDLIIVLGTSISVMPSAGLPRAVHERGGKVCIVNKQKTGSDKYAAVRPFTGTDLFLTLVMAELDLKFPPFAQKRKVYTWEEKKKWRAAHKCLFEGADDMEHADDEEVVDSQAAAEAHGTEIQAATGAGEPAENKSEGTSPSPPPSSQTKSSDRKPSRAAGGGKVPQPRLPGARTSNAGTGRSRSPPRSPPDSGRRTGGGGARLSRASSTHSTGSSPGAPPPQRKTPPRTSSTRSTSSGARVAENAVDRRQSSVRNGAGGRGAGAGHNAVARRRSSVSSSNNNASVARQRSGSKK